jgi:threonine dehydrogenase-like Zn-dependent dehydrogenase
MTPTPHDWRPDKEEAKPMYPIAVFVFAALTVGAAGLAWWRLRTLQRVIRVERAAVRLTEAAHHRDTQAFQRRITDAMAAHRAAELGEQVLTEADRIITAELARTTRHNPQEGETP